MSDMPKSLQQAAIWRHIALGSAVLLTVVGGWLAWVEHSDGGSPAPRTFVWSVAMVAWIAWIALTCVLLVITRVCKKIERVKVQVIEAIIDQRLEHLGRMVEGGNVRSINSRRR